jgi:hypothetical protein
MHWQTSRYVIDLSRPRVMGIVNITPDSFSDGGRHGDARSALAHCEQLLREGADILDLGGESSRPGAEALPLEEELARVLPVLREALRLGVPVSVDTYKTEVMQAALDAGADIVNDIFALRSPGAQAVVARHPRCGVCLMHMQGGPRFATSWQPGPGPCAGRAWQPIASCWTRVMVSGNRSSTISSCCVASANSWRRVARCWWAGPASLRLGRSPAERLANAWPPAWPLRWLPSSMARALCVCTTWLPLSTP